MTVATFRLHRDIVEFLSVPALKSFTTTMGLASGKLNKPDYITIIEQAVTNQTLSRDSLEEFLANEFRRGNNRTIYFSILNAGSSRKLRSLDYVIACFRSGQIPIDKYSNFLDNVQPLDETLVYSTLVLNEEGEVTKIELCYSSRVLLKSASEGVPRYDTDYSWIEIHIPTNRIVIRLRDRGAGVTQMHNQRRQYLSYLDFVRGLFNVSTEDATGYRNILYKVFSELTSKAEEPFVERVSQVEDEMNNYIEACIQNLPIRLPAIRDEFKIRVKGLLMRTMIQEDFKTYAKYTVGKKGIVSHYYYTDGTGASVNAKVGDVQKSISQYDIYLDTKQSIDKIKVMDKLWVKWFKDGKEASVTKFEIFKECYVIHFLYSYLTEEAEEYVLSKFKYFEELQG